MNRYRRANEQIHVPDALKRRTLTAERPVLQRRPAFLVSCAAVLAAAVLAVVLLWPQASPSPLTAYALAQPAYPQMAPYPDEQAHIDPETGEYLDSLQESYDAWWHDVQAQRQHSEGYTQGMGTFFTKTARQFLSGAGAGNRAYSPLNLYMALGMLAELTEGDSRQQVLSLLNIADMDTLRAQASALWNGAYRDDGAVTSVLASSLWLDERVPFRQETLDRLAQSYYASAYRGEMGSDAFNAALQDWLNEQTGGLLKDQVDALKLDAGTVMALATTVYFRAKWSHEFDPSLTGPGVFHGASGDKSVEFMRQSAMGDYYWGESFSAVAQGLENGGAMWFILPDEGTDVQSLLQDDEAMAFLFTGQEGWVNHKATLVNLTVPKFDISAQLSLREGLEALGVTDVFQPDASDFSPMTGAADGIFLSQAQQGVRVAIDEEGCTAAAYTVMMMAGAAMPQDEVDFTLDRPFLFAVTGADGMALFMGVVNQP